MSRQRLLSLGLGVLIATNLLCVALLLKARRTEQIWRDQVSVWAGHAAALEALSDFENGRLRVFELARIDLAKGGQQSAFTGRRDGPFEIWTRAYFAYLGPPDRYANEQFITAYNDKMRYMHSNPERFLTPQAGDKVVQ